MEDTDKKLAKEILSKISAPQIVSLLKGTWMKIAILKAMFEFAELYHQAKTKEQQKSLIIESFERENSEITDEDIEAWAEEKYHGWEHKLFVKARVIEGAKAFRDGLIKHIEPLIQKNNPNRIDLDKL